MVRQKNSDTELSGSFSPDRKRFLRHEADRQLKRIYGAIKDVFYELEKEVKNKDNEEQFYESELLDYSQYNKVSDIKHSGVLNLVFSFTFGTRVFGVEQINPKIYALARKAIIESELYYSDEQVLELIIFFMSDFIQYTVPDLSDRNFDKVKLFKNLYNDFIVRNYNENYDGNLSISEYFVEFAKNVNRNEYQYYDSEEDWEKFFNEAILDIHVPVDTVIMSQNKKVSRHDNQKNNLLKLSLIPIVLEKIALEKDK